MAFITPKMNTKSITDVFFVCFRLICERGYNLKPVFSSGGVGPYDLVKIENRSPKRSHKGLSDVVRRGCSIVRRQIVKITSGDVMTRVPLRLSRRSLAFYYGKVPSFTYSSLREYKPAVYFSF